MVFLRRHSHTSVSKRVATFYALLATITVPWTIYLAVELPENNLSAHWDVAWVGFDIGLLIMLLVTALLAYVQSRKLVIAASITAAMLIIDAWFDIVTARKGAQLDQSILLAIIIELPLAILSYRVAYRDLTAKQPS